VNAHTKSPLSTARHWSARLDLRFDYQRGRTRLIHNQHVGPLRVQRPFYPEGLARCHVYLLHPPGGLVEGDQLSIRATVDEQAHAILTTPGAGKLYRSETERQSMDIRLQVAAQASLEWLPQETILFDGAKANLRTHVTLTAESARFIGWDVQCFGRPSINERFEQGDCQQQFELWLNDQPIWIDRLRILPGSALLDAPWGLAGRSHVGTLVCWNPPPELLEALRAQGVPEQILAGLTCVGKLLVVRALAYRSDTLLAYFERLWRTMRPHVLAVEAHRPRIWAT